MELLGLLLGVACVASIGLFHERALLLLDRWTGPDKEQRHRTLAAIFVGLLLIHLVEAMLFAGVFGVCVRIEGLGTLGQGPLGWSDLLYFSLVNFTTVGYTQIVAAGPLRLISGLEALGGLMVLTWSATFLYSAWQGRDHRLGRWTWSEDGEPSGPRS